MINKVQTSPSFGSTRIKLLENEINEPVLNSLKKYLSPVEKEGLRIKAGLKGKKVTPQMVANDIVNGDVACTITSKDGDMFVNMYGKDAKTDNFVGKFLTKMFPNAKFTKNIK